MNFVASRLKNFFRPEALAFPRYVLKENETGIRLHQNESLGLSCSERSEFAAVLARALEKPESINIYPSLEPTRLLQAYAQELKVPVKNIEVTAGSSQALTLLAEAVFAPGRKIAITSPSFSLYAHLARLYGATVIDLELDENFNYSMESLFSKKVLECDVVLLCTPNNPTGTQCDSASILKFAETFSGLLVVDEAYVEFANEPERASFVQEAVKRDNVIVLRTLSKAWAAAGLRVGAVIAHEETIALFRALKPPYSIAWPSEVLATHILESKQQLTQERVARIVQMRNALQRVLRECSQVERLSESQANFVFFTTSMASELDSSLSAAGFIVRRYNSGRLLQAVRISMPPEQDFNRLKNILTEVLQ